MEVGGREDKRVDTPRRSVAPRSGPEVRPEPVPRVEIDVEGPSTHPHGDVPGDLQRRSKEGEGRGPRGRWEGSGDDDEVVEDRVSPTWEPESKCVHVGVSPERRDPSRPRLGWGVPLGEESPEEPLRCEAPPDTEWVRYGKRCKEL